VEQVLDGTRLAREKTRGEELLRHQLALTSVITQNAAEGLCLLDAAGRVVFVNPAAETILGLEAGALVGRSFVDAVSVDAAARAVVQSTIAAGWSGGAAVKNFEAVWMRADGMRITVLASWSPVVGSGGVEGLVVTYRDVSDYRRAQRDVELLHLQVEVERRQLEAILQQMPVGVVIAAAPTGQIMLSNQQAERMLGSAAVQARSVAEYGVLEGRLDDGTPLAPDGWPLARAVRFGETTTGQVVEMTGGRHANGAPRFYAMNAAPILNSAGGTIAAVLAIFDISAERQALAELATAKGVADEANSAKSAFLTNMSHEMRTPLNAMLGFAELLRSEETEGSEKRDFLDVIARNGEDLVHLIDELLDLSKVEAGRLEVGRVTCSLGRLLSEVSKLLEQRARSKGLGIFVRAVGRVPDRITTDPGRLKQILINVIGNAIKFTARGGIVLSVECERSSDGCAILSFRVRDSGIGLSPEQQARIFRPFVQADDSTTRSYGGTGLGLVLSRRLAELLGGSVWLADSKVGRGSTFVVTVRADPVGEEAAFAPYAAAVLPDTGSSAGSVRLAGLSILAVDDAVDGQDLLRRILGGQGASVEVARDGEEAVAMALQSNFDVILMDLQMPRLDGYEATRRLRRNGWRKPIIALTAHAMRGERERSIDAGCDEHLAKPVNPALLVETVARCVAGGELH
jgi:PAS domain S-box-containing protein